MRLGTRFFHRPRVPDAVHRRSGTQTGTEQFHGPRLSSAPFHAALRPGHEKAFSRRASARVVRWIRPSEKRGRRECRGDEPHPQPGVQWKKAHQQSHHRWKPSHGIPRAIGFNGFLRALPGDQAFLPPSSARCKASSPTWHLPWCVRTTRLRRTPQSRSSRAPPASIASRAQHSWRSRSAPLLRARDGAV